MHNKKLAIFDLDGTIFDSEYEVSLITESIARSRWQKEGEYIPQLQARHIFKAYAGLGAVEKFAAIANEHGIIANDRELQDMAKRHEDWKQALYDASKSLLVVSDVDTSFETLRHKGFTLCVGSSNPSGRSKRGLDKAGLRDHFNDRVYGPDLVGGRKKPDPAVFEYAMETNGAEPADTLVFEDTPPGMEAGKRAEIFVIAYMDPRFGVGKESEQQARRFYDAGADVIIRGFKETDQALESFGNKGPRPR
ncbi:MAG: HAD family phosphatase [Rhodospirillales bacterium]|nr:HAD family phosphatase [Rhodospirillales bacterium]